MNCFNSEMKRVCSSCINPISENKTCSRHIVMLKKTNKWIKSNASFVIRLIVFKRTSENFESAREFLLKTDKTWLRKNDFRW